MEGDDRHLDDDRQYDPVDHDLLREGRAVEAGARGWPVLELFLVDGSPTYRILDLPERAARAKGDGITVAGRTHYLRLIGEVLAELEEQAIRAPSARVGRSRVTRLPATELAARASEIHKAMKEAGATVPTEDGPDHTFVSDLGPDRIRFPWGEIEVQELTHGAKSSIDADALGRGWRAAVAAFRDTGRVDRGTLDAAWGARKKDHEKYARDFTRMLERWDVAVALAASSADAEKFRAAADERLPRQSAKGPVSWLEKLWLYNALHQGLLTDPDDIES